MNIDNKFLLVCLQLIIALLMSMKVEGMGREQRGNERAYRLFNQCALRYVLVHGNISASANESDVRGDLVLETKFVENDVRIQIRGHVSKEYLCFNRRGKLVAKSKTRGLLCDFVEVPSEHSWSYRSVHDPTWLVGFDPKGRPLRGLAHLIPRRPKDCFRFNKVGRFVDSSHFDVDSHNNAIGQTPPPLPSPPPPPPPSQHLRRHHNHREHRRGPHLTRQQLQQPTPTTAPTTTTTTANTPTTTSTTNPPRHSLRHGGKSHRRRPSLRNSLSSQREGRKKSQGKVPTDPLLHPVNIPTKKRR